MAVLGSRSTFRDVRAWYSKLAVLDRQICRIERPDGQPLGTGFLVAPDVLMTAQHVIPWNSANPGREIRARFDYARSPLTGLVLEGTLFELASDHWLLGQSAPLPDLGERSIDPAIDTALVRLAVPLGLTRLEGSSDVRGWVDLSEAVDIAPENSGLAILQHPEGGPLKLSVHTHAVLGFNEKTGRLMYQTDTLPGSSGAPCFDLDWKFVAMHEGRDVRGGNHNFGVPFPVIRDWLAQQNLWRFVAQRSPATTGFDVETKSPAETHFGMSPELKALLAKGEGQLIEFKRGIVTAAAERKGEMKKVLTSVAAFMNSREGGTVMIGIEDDGTIVGIQGEYPLVDLQSANWDGYERHLVNVLTDRLGIPSAFLFFTVARYHEEGKDVCAIHVRPSDQPVFLEDQLHVRVGAQNRPVKGREILTFAASRWHFLRDQAKPTETRVELERRLPGRARLSCLPDV